MFKSARWRSEKNKIKAVFRLQFHASPVSKEGGDEWLVISVVPADAGKASVKLDKAAVRDGSCYWDTPVLETVKFVREPKTGKINERLYYFIVGKGSSKAGVVGEASLDLSCYALATKTSSVSLPLKNSKSDIVLHISIQRVLEPEDQREIEESERIAEANAEDRSLRAKLSDDDVEEDIKPNSIDEAPVDKTVNQSAEMNGNRLASSGSDVTTLSSDSSMGLDNPVQVKNDDVKQRTDSFLSSVNNGSVIQMPNSDLLAENREEHQKSWEWLGGLSLEASTDDSSGTPREAILSEGSQEVQDIAVEKLKSELTALARQAEMSELELQTLRKQIVKESRRGHDLSKENNKLREERDAFREECEKLKALRGSLNEAKMRDKLQCDRGDSHTLIEELRQELNHEKDLNNNLRIQLQKTQESNSELILAVSDLDEMLEQKNKEILDLLHKYDPAGADEKLAEANCERKIDDDDDEQRALEELVKEHSDVKDAYLLEQKILDLQSDIEIYKREKDELEAQMEQIALDYEILKQENHDISYRLEQSQIQEQLKMQYECTSSYGNLHELEPLIEKLEAELAKKSQEFSDSLSTISELEVEVKTLQNELKERTGKYSGSLITISELEDEVKTLQNELKERSGEYSGSLITISKLEGEVKSLQNALKERSDKYSGSLMIISELEGEVRRLEDELRERSREYSDSSITIGELQTRLTSTENELEERSREYSDSSITISELQALNTSLESELKERSHEYSDSLITIRELQALITSLENEHKEQSGLYSDSLITISERQGQVARLENEIKEQEQVYSGSAITVSQLEDHVKSLEEVLEKQAQEYEADMEALTNAKVEQEQRAIRAEESLRKMRWQNASTAERLQEEFRNLSLQMSSTFQANESLANKALNEANELRLHKRLLEDKLEKASEELEMVRDHYEARLREMSGKLQSEIQDSSIQLDDRVKQVEESKKELIQEVQMLKADILALQTESKIHSDLAKERDSLAVELEEMRRSSKEMELLVQQGKNDRAALRSRVALLKEKEQSILGELKRLQYLKDEKDSTAKVLQLEVDALKAKCEELMKTLSNDELEMEDLKKKLLQCQGDLKRKEDAYNSIEKKIKANGQVPISRGPKEVANLKERIKLLEDQIKLKEATLEKSVNSFLEKEKDLHTKIEELEQTLEVLHQNTTSSCQEHSDQVAQVPEDLTLTREDVVSSTTESCSETLPAKESKCSCSHEDTARELLSEMALMKDRNKEMECELKEMQERYSEISLKFAEVEGERQQLVMRVRNLKNAKKNP